MKKRYVFLCLCIFSMLLLITGCSSKARKQAAYEQGQQIASSRIEKKEAPTLDEDALNENLGAKVENKKTEITNNKSQYVGEKEYDKVEAPTYYKDTNTLQIHKRNGGDCAKMQNSVGSVTLEAYYGDINNLMNDGYAKCPSCFIK